jgi:ketosteroid isomerase-like protein
MNMKKMISLTQILYTGGAIVMLAMVWSCNDTKYDPEVLMETDLKFSKMSEDSGVNRAFLAFCDKDVVILSDNAMPVTGRAQLADLYASRPDEAIRLTWKPEFAAISESGDLGYTYGFYELFVLTDSTSTEGTYVSIWKRQEDGSYKFVLDSGNQGLK